LRKRQELSKDQMNSAPTPQEGTKTILKLFKAWLNPPQLILIKVASQIQQE